MERLLTYIPLSAYLTKVGVFLAAFSNEVNRVGGYLLFK
jgi:hypothetical protein